MTVEVVTNAKLFDCRTCAAKHCDEDRKIPGSKGPAPYPLYEIDGVISTNTCLLPLVTPWANKCIDFYSHYKKGVLLMGGGLLDQPNVYLEAMNVIQSTISSNEAKNADKRGKTYGRDMS